MANTTGYGIKKVSENVLKQKRALIYTETEREKINWNDVPYGSIKINEDDGTLWAKVKDASDWVPAGIKNDGTICIAKDAIVREETYTIGEINQATKKFTYINSLGTRKIGEFTDDGFMIFEVDYEYQLNRNLLEIYVDNVLKRTVSNGGIREIDYTRFALLEDVVVGQTVTIKYCEANRIGNPYPRMYIHDDEPRRAEVGDFWIDTNGELDNPNEDDPNYNEGTYTIPWEQVTGKPTTIAGYGIDDQVAHKEHFHHVKDILDFPTKMPANGGEADNADMVDYCHAGINPGNVFKIPNDGKLPANMIPSHTHDASQINNLVVNPFIRGMIMMWYGSSRNVPSGWAICNGSNGTPDLRHKFVEGCDNDEIGTHMQAGLPNVTGTFGVWKMDPLTNGAFSQKQDRGCNTKNGGGDPGWTVDLDASRSSVIYGKSATVQPEAIKMHFIMKL